MRNLIEQMSEEEIIRNIDCFLLYEGMDISNITMKKRKKALKDMIVILQIDNDYTEYWMGICYDREKLKNFNTVWMQIIC